jgi:O-antigen ligase
VAVAACLLGGLMLFPSLKTDIDRFIKKDTAVAEARGSTSQLLEEKRYEMWSGVWPLFWREKLTGYGFASSHLLVFPFTRDKEAGRSIHNSYLETFGDLGLIGLSLLLLILYRILAKTLALIQRREDYRERNVNAVFIAILIAGLFNAFFESWMFSVGNLTSLLFWGPASGVVARWAWRPVEESPESGVQSPESWLGVHEREAISNETEKSKSETLVLTPESGGRTLD